MKNRAINKQININLDHVEKRSPKQSATEENRYWPKKIMNHQVQPQIPYESFCRKILLIRISNLVVGSKFYHEILFELRERQTELKITVQCNYENMPYFN